MRLSAVSISSERKRQIVRIFFFSLTGLAGWSLIQSLFGDTGRIFRDFYLVPWTLLVCFVLLTPFVYLYATGRFSLFHPLVYPVWSYLFPAFVLGSLYLAISSYEPHFIWRIPNREYYLPLALVYVAVGFAGLMGGYSLRTGHRLGERLSRRLPTWNWQPDQVVVPCLVLIAVGRIFELEALTVGVTGYQIVEDSTAYGNTYYSLIILASMANLILWITIFKAPRFRLRHYILVALLIGLILYSMLIAGGKGELLKNVIAILFAYWCSGRRYTWRKGIVAGALIVFAIFAGFIYGTTFRQLKVDESRIPIGDYFELGASTISTIRDVGIWENAGFVIENALQRFETLISLSVVVANYEALSPLEGDYGIGNNIWTDTWTAFIPRFIWPEKPLISDARSYSALYFDIGDNSLAITPFGDLLRNFGPIGVPLGMGFLGIFLRVMYVSLIKCEEASSWRAVCYFILLSNISYEGFYGSIFPGLLRASIILLIGGVSINTMYSLFIKK